MKQAYASMNFMLTVNGQDLPCKNFRSIQQEIEYEGIQEGGINNYVHIRKKPVTKPFTFQVERYVGPGYRDPFTVGKEVKGTIVLKAGRKRGDTQEYAQFTFSGCIVTGKNYSDMDAEKSGLLTETTTVAYERLAVDWKGGI